MRTVSFVDHLDFEFEGTVSCKAIGLGDVDNDQCNELIVGNTFGDLVIFKGSNTEPWRKCSDLGMITCVEVGDICNRNGNFLVVSCLEGWCNIFAVKPDPQEASAEEKVDESLYRFIKPCHRQRLAANSKVLLIADIDGDGFMELVIGYSDRRVRSFRWHDGRQDANTEQIQGQLVPIDTWMLAGQIGSLTVHKKKEDASVELMASQPGGTFVTLIGKKRKNSDVEAPEAEELTEEQEGTNNLVPDVTEEVSGPSLLYHPVGSARARNPGVSTEVIGNISRHKRGEETHTPSYCAICTLDGTLTLLDEDKILWSLYVDHQLFTLSKLDVTGDGTEEVVVCSSDGHTYIVNLSKNVVRFTFEESVAAFCGGYYTVKDNLNIPCLIYLTFNNRICIYYNIQMPEIGLSNLIEVMADRPELQELYNYFNCDASKSNQVRDLYHWCLYGLQPKPS